MKQIGIRELRQHASRYLRLVAAGETVEVTDRGRPVARLSPIPDRPPLERLVEEGRMSPPAGDLFDLGEPVEPDPDTPLPSDVLLAARDDER